MTEAIQQDPPTRPHEMTIVADGRALAIAWPDGGCVMLDAELLWKKCPSAAGRRRQIDGCNQPHVGDLRLVAIQPIGHYAVNIAFSDGHDRGVYPWHLLRQLSAKPKLSDFLIADARASEDDAINQRQ